MGRLNPSSLHFNGTNASVQFSGGMADLVGNVPWTFECLVNPAIQDATNRNIIGNSAAFRYSTGHLSLINGRVNIRNKTGAAELSGNTLIFLNSWSHIALVHIGGGRIQLFVNGLFDRNFDIPVDANLGFNMSFLGQAQGAQRWFSGRIDEVRLWTIARTQAQIQSTMWRPLQGNETGLLEYFKLDEATGTIVNNSVSGTSKIGTITNATWFTDNCHLSPALHNSFQLRTGGAIDSRIIIPSRIFSGITRTITLEFRVKLLAHPAAWWTYFYKGGPLEAEREFCFFQEGANARQTFNPHFNNQIPNILMFTFLIGVWYHISWIVDRNNRLAILYVNGVERFRSTNAVTIADFIWDDDLPMFLGPHETDVPSGMYGIYDEFRLWDVIRTPAQINEAQNRVLIGNETGLRALYKFNEGPNNRFTNNLASNPNFKDLAAVVPTATQWLPSELHLISTLSPKKFLECSYVNPSLPDINYFTSTHIPITTNNIMLVKTPTSQLDGTLKSAIIRLGTYATGSGTLRVARILNNWNPSTVTFNNRPNLDPFREIPYTIVNNTITLDITEEVLEQHLSSSFGIAIWGGTIVDVYVNIEGINSLDFEYLPLEIEPPKTIHARKVDSVKWRLKSSRDLIKRVFVRRNGTIVYDSTNRNIDSFIDTELTENTTNQYELNVERR